MVSAETPSENIVHAQNLFTIHVDNKITRNYTHCVSKLSVKAWIGKI